MFQLGLRLDQLIESRTVLSLFKLASKSPALKPKVLGSPARNTQVPLVPAWISFNNLVRAAIMASSLAR